jgi:hypothetical protein
LPAKGDEYFLKVRDAPLEVSADVALLSLVRDGAAPWLGSGDVLRSSRLSMLYLAASLLGGKVWGVEIGKSLLSLSHLLNSINSMNIGWQLESSLRTLFFSQKPKACGGDPDLVEGLRRSRSEGDDGDGLGGDGGGDVLGNMDILVALSDSFMNGLVNRFDVHDVLGCKAVLVALSDSFINGLLNRLDVPDVLGCKDDLVAPWDSFMNGLVNRFDVPDVLGCKDDSLALSDSSMNGLLNRFDVPTQVAAPTPLTTTRSMRGGPQ